MTNESYPGTYHLGLIAGTGLGTWANGHRKTTVVLQARRDVDYMSPDLWMYIGRREVTKAHLERNKVAILTWVNGYYGREFTHLVID